MSALLTHLPLLLQLLLVVAVVNLYAIEGPAFAKVIALAAGGFAVSLVTPRAWRMHLFVALSLAGIVWVLGPADGAWLIALALALIGVAHLPIPIAARAVALVALGIGLAVLRAGLGSPPWSPRVWPIVGSIFMFRMVLYVRALAAGHGPREPWSALAYFFMLPNVAFPLFPVVDFQTFQRTWFDRDEAAIYRQGLGWISRGLVHLLLYRLVYSSFLGDPLDVATLGDLVQFMLATFLLYLRVSGQFHLIVGLLHLFGFRLPETHKLYYLAHSFTELWRRINIYWTDFMMKAVFYPTYFKVKGSGPATAFALSTAAVFVTTWLLHSYQWFWLRGGFPMTAPDILFWAILGGLVIRAGLKELRAKKSARRKATGWNWRLGANAAVTFAGFCFLWSLWSAESVAQWLWMLGAASEVDARGVLLLLGALGVILALGGWDWDSAKKPSSPLLERLMRPQLRALAPLVVLLALALPGVHGALPQGSAALLHSLRTTGLNARDAALQHRGYYEQLDVRAHLNAPTVGAFGIGRDQWQAPADAGIIHERTDRLGRDLHPSLSITWNGNRFSTNEFGMRDQPYTREKPPSTLRIALLGPSHVMGNGVGDGETFEALVEERLNRERANQPYAHYEILNFAVDGYTLPQQLAIFEERALGFSPDIVLITQYHFGKTMTERYLLRFAWSDPSQLDPEVQQMLAHAGLMPMEHAGIPLPFAPLRAFAGSLGIRTRMSWAESQGRIRRISEDVNGWAIGRLAQVAREHGVKPIVVALNAVIPDVPPSIRNRAEIDAAGLPLIDLYGVFPEEQRPALRVAPWDEHPNAEGHRLIAERLYTELVPYLTR